MKYSHFIKLMKDNCKPDKEQIYNDIISQKSNSWIKVFAIVCAAVLLIGIVGTGAYYGISSMKRGEENHLPDELYEVSPITAITATQTKGDAVLVNTAFEITTKDVHSAKDIYEFLEISPKTEYNVKKTSGNTFNVTLKEALKENTLYKLSSKLGTKTVYSWAFQTEAKFEITASCAGKSGCAKMSQTQEIWVEFSRSDVENFEQYFSISPAVSGTFEQYGKRWVFIPSSDFAKNTIYKVTISKDIISGDGQTLENDYSFNIFSCVGSLYANCISASYGGDRFTTKQVPSAVIEYKNVNLSNASVKVYKSSSAEKYISVFNQYVKGGVLSSAISERFNESSYGFEATFKTDSANNRAYLAYPEPLEAGFYIAQIVMGELTTYHLFEVSDYTLYASYANEKVAIWVIDSNTQKAVPNIAVADNQGNIKATDQNGAAVMEHKGGNEYAYLSVSTPTPTTKIVSTKAENNPNAQSGHSFIRTDKAAYSKGDIVKVFGFTVGEHTVQDKYEIKCSWENRTISITPDSSGVFTCAIDTNGVLIDKKGYIDFYINGEIKNSVFVDIYSKEPELNIEITTDSNCYIEGETVSFNVFATLSDGTPAENIAISLNGATYTTSSRGLVQITESATANDGKNVIREFKVNEQSYYVDYTVFKSNNFITDVQKNDDGTLSVYVNTVDKKAPDFIGAPAECEAIAEMYLIDYVQKGSVPYYDTVTLQQINDPVYAVNTILQGTETIAVTNGVAKIPISDTDHNRFYIIKVGNDEYRYYPYGDVPSEYADTNSYSLQYKNEYEVGEAIAAKLCKNSPADIVTEGGQLFISFISANNAKTEVFDASNISFSFDESFDADVIVDCAYMIDDRIYKVNAPTIKKKEKRLKISVTFDKTDYAPGDTVNMNIQVKGSDGYPTPAALNINVYDSKLYNENGFTNANNKYLSSPLFETIKTDSTGNAKVSFTLDKSIANWKVDILAFDQNSNEGRLISKIKATSSMYVDTYISEKIFATDELSFAFRVDGTAVTEQYDYSAVLLKDGVQIATKSGVASFQQVKNESFGLLTENDIGKYTVKIICASGENSCESEKEFELTKRTVDVTELTMQDSTDIDKDKFDSDITVNVYDAEYELYFKVIEKMLEKSSDRIDHLLANALAKSIVNGKDISKEESALIADYASNNGIFVYPNRTSATVSQAALICTAASDLFDKASIKEYFDKVLKGRPDTLSLISINSVLASIGEPVLFELDNLYEGLEGYTDEQKLFLALAFANAGDFNRAYSIINNGLMGKILTANGISTFEAETPAATEYMSCVAAIVTSKLSQSNAKDLVKGLMNTSNSTLTGLAYHTFIKSCVPYFEGENTIKYKNADGKEEKITFSKTESVAFNIERENIDKVSIESVKGDNVCTIAATKAAIESGYTKLENKQSSVLVQNGNITDGSIVKIDMAIDTTACDMQSPYAVFDIPHGLKLVKANVTSGNGTVDNNRTVYMSGVGASVQLECYAAIEGEYTVVGPTVIDRKSKQFIDGGSVKLKIN